MCALFWLNVISCHQSNGATVHQSYYGRELVSAFGILLFSPLEKFVRIIVWHIISLFQRAVLSTVHFLELLVCTSVFCLKVYGPNRPFPLSSPGLAVAFLRGGTAPATVMSDQCCRQTRRVTRGNGALLLDWVSVGIVSAHLHQSWMDRWNKDKYFDVVRTWRLKITSQVMSINAYPSRLQGHFVFTAAKWLSRLDKQTRFIAGWLCPPWCLFVERRTHFNQKGSQSVLSHQMMTKNHLWASSHDKTLFKQQFKIHGLLLCETCQICLKKLQ